MDHKYTVLRYHALIIDKVNREGIPKMPISEFDMIGELDWICENAGAEKVEELKLPFSPFRALRIKTHAETLFRVGNTIIHNKSEGYHPDRQTTIYIYGKAADSDIVERFNNFYGREPRVAGQPIDKSPEQLEKSIANAIRNIPEEERERVAVLFR